MKLRGWKLSPERLGEYGSGRQIFISFFSAPVSPHCPTCYLGDSNLAAAAAFPSLAEGFNLDDVVLVDWQRQLQGGGVGLHHAGTAVLVLAVHHLQGAERGGEGAGGVIAG